MDKSFEARLCGLLLLAAVPPAVLLVGVMLANDMSVYLTSLVGLTLLMSISLCAASLYRRVNYQFRTLSNLLEAMTKGEFSLRGRRRNEQQALGELVGQINMLADTLSSQRLQVKEHQLLLAKVISQIDVGIIAIDAEQRISLINPAAASLLNDSVDALSHQDIRQFDLPGLEHNGAQTLVEWQFPHRVGKFQIHLDQFIEQGISHKLLFITDVQDLLRREERKIWQNLIRVLSHEINNSLTPIKSLSQMVYSSVKHQQPVPEGQEDQLEALQIITERAASLRQFIDSYRQLAKLPDPQPVEVSLSGLVDKVVALFEHRPVQIDGAKDLMVKLDAPQFEQLLINLIKNADEAMTDPQRKITIEWRCTQQNLQLTITDDGPGLTNSDNLFVPFYTTKPQGSGIGLVLCRQIAEGHGGYLSVKNRPDTTGCVVTVDLPARL